MVQAEYAGCYTPTQFVLLACFHFFHTDQRQIFLAGFCMFTLPYFFREKR